MRWTARPIRLRENGPYAIHARLHIAGQPDTGPVRRRTLCRCGASANKPFCDGSHAKVDFKASGEPDTQPMKALQPRDGVLTITPMRDGPMEI